MRRDAGKSAVDELWEKLHGRSQTEVCPAGEGNQLVPAGGKEGCLNQTALDAWIARASKKREEALAAWMARV